MRWVDNPPGIHDVVWHLSFPISRHRRFGFALINGGKHWFFGSFFLKST